MPVVNFIWDLEDPGETTSRSSGLPTVFGWTSTGLYIAVIFEIIDPATAEVYPVTAYEVDPPRTKKRKKR